MNRQGSILTSNAKYILKRPYGGSLYSNGAQSNNTNPRDRSTDYSRNSRIPSTRSTSTSNRPNMMNMQRKPFGSGYRNSRNNSNARNQVYIPGQNSNQSPSRALKAPLQGGQYSGNNIYSNPRKINMDYNKSPFVKKNVGMGRFAANNIGVVNKNSRPNYFGNPMGGGGRNNYSAHGSSYGQSRVNSGNRNLPPTSYSNPVDNEVSPQKILENQKMA